MGRRAFVLNLIYKLNGRAFIIYQSKPQFDWKTLKKDLSDGIADKKSIPTLQNELLSLQQYPHQTVTDFAETIRQKLKQLSDKVKELYDTPSVQQSFLTEHEKMAVRAFKEGLQPPLKYRILASNETTFDRIRPLALEEEPFVPQNHLPPIQREMQPRAYPKWHMPPPWQNQPPPFHHYTPQWRQPSYHNPYHNTRQQRFYQPPPNYQNYERSDCSRCGRTGHTRNNCYANLNNRAPVNQMHSIDHQDPKNEQMDETFGNPVQIRNPIPE